MKEIDREFFVVLATVMVIDIDELDQSIENENEIDIVSQETETAVVKKNVDLIDLKYVHFDHDALPEALSSFQH